MEQHQDPLQGARDHRRKGLDAGTPYKLRVVVRLVASANEATVTLK